MMKLREIPYTIREVGNQGMKVKVPDKWAAVHGWEPGDLIFIGYFENKITATKRRRQKLNQAGKYRIAADKTIYIPSAIREKLTLAKNDGVAVYAEGDILYYERVDK